MESYFIQLENCHIKNNIKLNAYLEEISLNNKKNSKSKITPNNSQNLNKQNNKLYSENNCIYNPKDNSIYLIIHSNYDYSKLKKEKMIKILEYSINEKIDSIYLFIEKTNKNYYKILQDMKIVGFILDDNLGRFMISNNMYKVLKMSIKDINQEVKEIILI